MEPLERVVECRVVDQPERGEARLASRRHEHDHRLGGRVLANGGVRGLVHRRHARAVVLAGVARDVHLQLDGTHRVAEVIQPAVVNAQPVAQVLRVRQRRAEADDADVVLQLLLHEADTRDDHFNDGTTVGAEEVDFIDDDHAHLLHVLAVLPLTTHTIPLLRRRHDDVRVLHLAQLGRRIARQLDDLAVKAVLELLLPVQQLLAHQRLQRPDVHRLLALVRLQQAHHRQLRHHRLARARRRAHQNVVVRVVRLEEYLRLHRVEVREAVERLVSLVLQRRHRQRVQVQQRRLLFAVAWHAQTAERQVGDNVGSQPVI